MMYAIHKRTKHHVAITEWNHDFWHYYIVTFCEDWSFKKADPDGWIEWQGGECPLPDGQRYEVKNRDGEWGEGVIGKWVHGSCQKSFDIIAYRPILDTKPEAPAWDGEGLPPVGCECEVLAWSKWHRIVVTAIGDSMMLVKYIDSTGSPEGNVLKTAAFRPIRSEENRAAEEMIPIICNNRLLGIDGEGARDIARALYRAGYRKEST